MKQARMEEAGRAAQEVALPQISMQALRASLLASLKLLTHEMLDA